MAKVGAIIGISAAALVVIIAAVFLFSGVLHRGTSAADATGASNYASSGAQTGAPNNAQAASQNSQGSSQQNKIKFADTRYANYAYDISDNATSQRETAALAGFDVKKSQNTDGSLRITLKALEPQYHDQSYTVSPGQKLYFIEGSFGDDSGKSEYSLGDDMAVLVDAQGYVVQ